MKQMMRYISVVALLMCSMMTWAADRVVIVTPKNGTVTVDKANPTGNATVTLTVTPTAGEYYITLADIVVEKTSSVAQTRTDGPAIVGTINVTQGKVEDNGAGTYTFSLPEGFGARVSATFTECASFTPVVTIKGWTSGETANAPSLGDTNKSGGAVTYTYSVKGTDKYADKVPTEAGDYTVKASIAAKGHYKAAEATADFNIAPAPEPEPDPEPEPEPEPTPEDIIVDSQSPVGVGGETFYKLTDEAKELVANTILANIALPAEANLSVEITPEGYLAVKKGTDINIAVRHLKVDDVIQFVFTGKLFGNSSWLLKISGNSARGTTRTAGDLELESGAYYSVREAGDMIVTIKSGELESTIKSIIVSTSSTDPDPDPDPDPEPTGIKNVDADGGIGILYDLQGRRVTQPRKGGLYIRNGKKVIF